MNKQDKKAIVGVFETHIDAIHAIQVLKKHHFPIEHLALVGSGGAVKEIDGVHTWEEVMIKGTEIGGIVGGILGALTGLTLVLVPEIGIIYTGSALAGALLGGIEGGAFGALGGNVLGMLFGARMGADGEATGKEDPEDLKKYKKLIQDGKFLLVVHGPKEEVEKAHQILIDEPKVAFLESQYLTTY
ncbi:MAG: hypothetical protein MUE85_04665 [Microscillaceae bacterium]|jgi:hypothetical protein|nr:hypothetical protein [Microscillaceae bacterium]